MPRRAVTATWVAVALVLSVCTVFAQSSPPLGLADPADRAERIARKEAALNARGVAERPTALAASAGSVRLDVVEDETVRSDVPDMNFHPAACAGGLYVGAAAAGDYGVGGQARSYLKFDASGIPADSWVTQAELWVCLLCDPGTTDKEIGAYGAADDWYETTITWNSAPPITGGPYSSISPPLYSGTWYAFDVTSLIAAEVRGDRVATIVLREVSEGGVISVKYFNEKDCLPSRAAYIDVQYGSGANAGPDQTVEQTTPAGAEVMLDGSASVAPYQPPPPTTYDAAVAAGAIVVSVGQYCTSWGFGGDWSPEYGQFDFGICPGAPIAYYDWWHSVTSSGATYPGYYLVGYPAGGAARPWAQLAGEYVGHIDIYQDDWSPPSVVPWRLFLSPDGTQLAWVRLPGINSYEWYEGSTLIGSGPVIEVTLSLGIHVITLKVTNTAGVSATDEAIVTVVDTTPPLITPPADVTVEQAQRDGSEVVLGEPDVYDICDAAPQVGNDAPPIFPLGTTTVTWTATDESGNSAVATQAVTVVDATPPEMTFTLLKTTLSSNRKLYLSATVSGVSDICDADPTVSIDVTANEAIDPPGSAQPDWYVIRQGDTWEIWLRGEHSSNSQERVYTIVVSVSDDSGNTTTDSGTVTVPVKGKGGGKPPKGKG